MDKSKERAISDAIGRLTAITGRANVITKAVKDIRLKESKKTG